MKAPSDALLARVPVRLYVFDVLHLDGEPLWQRTYVERRRLLDGMELTGSVVDTPPYRADAAGQDLLAAARELGLEGVVAKRLDSPYQPGRRSPLWVKTPLNTTAEVVIAGWKPGAGRREGMIGSLLLGVHDDGQLVYVGHVGTVMSTV